MEIRFRGYDRTKKAWFGKVSSRASQQLSALLSDVPLVSLPEMFAGFDPQQSEKVVLQKRVEGTQRDLSIVFAAKNWLSLGDAVPDAVVQLASAVWELAPEQARPQIDGALAQAGFPKLLPISQRTVHVRPDRREHLVIMLESPDFSEQQFEELYERLDEALQAAKAGEVTGSGHGMGGRNLDVSLSKRSKGRKILRQHLAALPPGTSVRASIEGSEGPISL